MLTYLLNLTHFIHFRIQDVVQPWRPCFNKIHQNATQILLFSRWGFLVWRWTLLTAHILLNTFPCLWLQRLGIEYQWSNWRNIKHHLTHTLVLNCWFSLVASDVFLFLGCFFVFHILACCAYPPPIPCRIKKFSKAAGNQSDTSDEVRRRLGFGFVDPWFLLVPKREFGYTLEIPGRLTWNLRMMVWKMIFLFNWVIFRFQPLIFRGVSPSCSMGSGICTCPWQKIW